MSPSNGPHVMKCLHENLDLLGPAGTAEPKNVPLYDLSNALIGIYEDIEAEFRQLDERLKRIEQRLQR